METGYAFEKRSYKNYLKSSPALRGAGEAIAETEGFNIS